MAIARVYQSGIFVVYTQGAETELTQVITEDINNFADAISFGVIAIIEQAIAEDSDNYADDVSSFLVGTLEVVITEDTDEYADSLGLFIPSLHFTDDINNFLDAIGIVGLDYVLVLVDQIPGFTDSLAAFYEATRSINEDADNWLDALVSTFAGAAQLNPGEDISTNQDDALEFVFGMELRIGDSYTISDGSDKVLGSVLSLAESIDNFDDSLSMGGLNELQLVLTDSIDNFEDSVSPEYPRRNPTSRSTLTPYIRRYLNDVEVN